MYIDGEERIDDPQLARSKKRRSEGDGKRYDVDVQIANFKPKTNQKVVRTPDMRQIHSFKAHIPQSTHEHLLQIQLLEVQR